MHVQNIGWMNWVNAGETAGTSHQSLRLEGLRMRLTGELANHYTIMYHVHIQDYGDAQDGSQTVRLPEPQANQKA